MRLKPLKTMTGLDYIKSKMTSFNQEFIDQLMKNPFIKGNMIEVNVSTTATAFNHGLGVTPEGWIVVDRNADVRVWRTAWNDKTITLDASGSASIKVWVY